MRIVPFVLLVFAVSAASALIPAGAHAAEALADTMTVMAEGWPVDSAGAEPHDPGSVTVWARGEPEWLKTPFGDNLLTHPDLWRSSHQQGRDLHLSFDYNRVDLIRYGLAFQAQRPETMYPRMGARIEVASARRRILYGAQLEQPLLPTARFAVGVSVVRRTDHSDLQQTEDIENAAALLFARTDYRDYFEREGYGAYLSWRVPDFSTVSVHGRRDQYRSLMASSHVKSLFRRHRQLRPNPAIDEGEARSVLIRLERLAHRTDRTRAGLYHWVEAEKSGGDLGGDFEFTRVIADLRSVLRLSPASTLSLRGVAGATPSGSLPLQKQFTAGGVDGLRAHPQGSLRGEQIALAQAEYTLGLWRVRTKGFEGGLHAIAFADAGAAWDDANHGYAVHSQKFALDGGFGLATSEDELRVYLAKDLQNPASDLVISVRLQRPF
ncbi:MAG: BamA/TamA family outer membrane protein [Candidatus Eisenbacteria bacterium]